MTHNVIYQTPTYRVTSFGNGLMYVLELASDAEPGVSFQGDAASEFLEELEHLTSGRCAVDYETALRMMWEEYKQDA